MSDLKRIKGKIIGSLLLSLIAINIDAQVKCITGQIKDEYGNGISNVILLLSDTTLTNREHSEFTSILETDSLGYFSFIKDTRINKIIANRIGYKPAEASIDSTTKHIDIIMHKGEDYILEEVTIKGNAQAVKMNNRGLEYDMKYSPVKQGTTMDALRFIPLIHMNNDNIQIIGKNNVRYYLNGKEIRLEGNALQSYIQSLSVDNIEKIEIITSYDPKLNIGFNQGGINIITKRKEDEGWKGYVQARIWKTHYWKGSGNLQLSYTKNKLNANLFFSGAHTSTWQDKYIKTRYNTLDKKTENNSIYDGKNTDMSFQGLFNYTFNNKRNLSGNASIQYSKGKQKENGLMQYLSDKDNTPYAEIMHDNLLDSDNTRINAGMTYQNIINDQSLFQVSINYYYGNAESSLSAKMDSVKDNTIGYRHEHYKEIIPQKSSVLSGDAVYTFSLGQKTSFSLECDFYSWNIDNNDRFLNKTEAGWEINKLSTHHLKVKEWNYSGTISMQNNWSKIIRSVIGTGMIRRNYRSKELTTQTIFEQGFWQPRPFVLFMANPNNQFSFRYYADYQLSNPSFAYMNPFKWYTSATTYQTGNPNLSQVKNFSQDITLQFLQNYMLYAGHKYSDDVIVYYNTLKENGIIESRPENMASFHELTVYLSMNNISYLKGKGNFRITAGITREWYNAKIPQTNAPYKFVSDSYFMQFNNTTSLFGNRGIQMINSLNYNSKKKRDFSEYPASIYLFTSFQKGIKNWNFNLNFSISSFLYGSKIRQIQDSKFENPELLTLTHLKGEAVSCAFQISYNFGNKNVKTIRQSASSSRNLGGRVK